RVCALIHLLTGAKCIGVESQAELIARALKVEGVAYVHGDAVRSTPDATHYFLYCPFDAQSVERWLNALPRKRPAWIGCVDFPLPRRDWIEEAAAPSAELQLYRLTPASSS
ncbi:MAG: hypothetical protein JNM17_18930, partial [Archangium sp.]|nr:hypothetical protein [Archangium sp.]